MSDVKAVFLALLLCGSVPFQTRAADLSTNSWRMWPDTSAAWANDPLFLPQQAVLPNLPVNPPTGGWSALNNSQGIAVTLPSSVEQYYWGAFGGATGGNYPGVSWWWCTFTAPTLQPGQRLIIQFRAARLRAEVYCNQKLCAYNIINEVPFTADITDDVQPGTTTNQLAVRITSPGGDLDWGDFSPITWGTNMISDSRGIGGLDESIILEARDPVCVSDFAVLNRPNPQEVWLVGAVTNAGATAYNGPVSLAIQDSNAIPVWQGTNILSVPAGGQIGFTNDVVVANAAVWDLTNPVLYAASAAIPGNSASALNVNFGFRWFTPVGFGSNAMLQLNGRRVVLRSAISWGWWAPNGLFPTDALAEQEVLDAQALGLNCLQFHRNLGHQNVLDQQDRLGLLRYEEPGDGEATFGANFSSAIIVPTDLSGAGGAPVTFLQQYEVDKILSMVKRDRSHPSLVVYDIQNEIEPCLTNSFIFWLLQQIRQIDPSRTVCLHSGIGFNNEVLMPPYSTNFLYENGNGYSGWSDQHTVGGPGNYQDNLYINATNYSHYSTNAAEVVVWGEMLGVGMPDDHDAIVTWYQTNGVVKTGYDLQVHQLALAAYNAFLDKWNFRPAFPTASSLFQAIGTKSYFFWQKLMENGRMCDINDFLVMSGWESTAIDNHSGLVDQHRNFRADPGILKQAMNPEVLVLRSKRLVVKRGETADVDVHLINETGRTGPQTLTLTALNPDGSVLFSNQSAVTVPGGNVFGSVLATNLTFVTTTNGTVLINGTIQPNGGSGSVLTNQAQLLVIDPVVGNPLLPRVAVCEPSNQITATLSNVFNLDASNSSSLSSPLDAIVMTPAPNSTWPYSPYNTGVNITGTLDPGLFQNQMFGPTGTIGSWFGFAPGNITVQLYFAETFFTSTGQRVFDVALNGATVLSNFDIFKQAGGEYIALTETFTVNSANGAIALSIPNIEQNNAQLAAIKITDANSNVTAVVFSNNSFTDHTGLTWQPYVNSLVPILPVTGAQWQTALGQVYTNGVRLVLWPNGISEAMLFANQLAASNIVAEVDCNGNAGFLPDGIASWLGSWYFCRQHWLLDGLPTNSVLGWQYQVPHLGTDVGAMLLDSTPTCPMDVPIGYGRNHEPCVAIGGAVVQYGNGTIVLLALPGLRDALTGTNAEITQPVAQRLLGNTLRTVTASLPLPPTDLTATPGNAQVTLSWHPAFGGTNYNLMRSTISGGPYTMIANNLTVLGYLDTGLANGTTYYYVASAVNALGESSNSDEVAALPQVWPGMDIGDVGTAGSTSQSGDIITVNGSGADIYNNADAFQFAPQLVSGDCDIRALVDSVQDTDPWAKAGVMIRASLDADAANIAMVMSFGNGAEIQYRSSVAGSTSYADNGGLTAPYWVRLTRTGNNFAGYMSPDGTNWTQLGGTQTITMSSNVYVGLAVTSHNYGTVCAATFTKVSLVSLPSPWQTADIGSVGVTGSAFVPNGIFTVFGSGADINNTADAFRYVYQTNSGNCDVMAQVLTVGDTDPSAKAGVMIRETLNPNAANAAVLITPGSGVSFSCRTNTGGNTSLSSDGGKAAPYWVRVIRNGNEFTGYASANGTNWLQIGASTTIAMANNVYIGLPVTSHNNSYLCTATFTNATAVLDGIGTNLTVLSPIDLNLAKSLSGGLLIQWPYVTNATGGSLYYTPSLMPPVMWTLLTNSPALSNNQWLLTLPGNTNAAGFYQLH